MNDLMLFTTKTFNGVYFDCYVEQEYSEKDFWATRTQIGQLLEYSEPSIAIGNIHNRNKDRLDRFSRVSQIDLPSGGAQEVVLYNFKGLLEICRYSNQPKANAVMDWLWDVADEIIRTGNYILRSTSDHEAQLKAIDLERAKFIQSMTDLPALHLSDESKAVIIHEAFKIITGHECLAILHEDRHRDNVHLSKDSLNAIRKDLLNFVHRVAVSPHKSQGEVEVLPAIAELLLRQFRE